MFQQLHVVGAGTAAGVDAGGRGRRLAGMAAGATLGENDLAPVQHGRIAGQERLASGRVAQLVGPSGLEEEQGGQRRLLLGCLPVGRALLRCRDRDGRDRLAARQRVEMAQPLLAVEADIDVDPVQGTQRPHRIRAVLQDSRRERCVRRPEEIGERTVLEEVVELLVQEFAAGQLLLAPPLRLGHAWAEIVDRVHGARVVDVVGRDQRGVERARPRRVHQLVHVVAGIRFPGEDPVDPEILRAHGRAHVLPFRVRGVVRRRDRARPDMAEAARHPHAVGPHQILGIVVVGVRIIPYRVPVPGGRLIEFRVREQAQAQDTRRLAIVGSHRQVLAAGADRHAGVLLRVGERIGRAVGAALVQPQAEVLGVGPGRLVEAGLVGQAQIGPPVGAVVLERRVGGDGLEQVEGAERPLRHQVPEPVVTAGPDQPHVAALDLVGGQRDAVVHSVKIVFVGRRERLRGATGGLGLVGDARLCTGHRRDQAWNRRDQERQERVPHSYHARPSIVLAGLVAHRTVGP